VDSGTGAELGVVAKADATDWLDAGHCRDCFLPAYNYRPGGSTQYALAIGNFDQPGPPRRFRFGLLGSSDVHSARPGTGYKEFARIPMTEARGSRNEHTSEALRDYDGPALDRARTRLAEKRGLEEVEKLKTVLAEVAPDAMDAIPDDSEPAVGRFEKLINIKDRGQIFRVDVDTIERIEAAGDYMCIYTGDNSLILRETMKDLERRLDPRVFQRVHRSKIVNLDRVRQVRPHTNGECFLVLDSGSEVKVSRSYRDVVARFVH
jgi:hypothetical protein